MLNLYQQFTRLYLTENDGVPHRLVPYLGAQEIVLGEDPILFPVERITNGSVNPSTVVAGNDLTFTLPSYTGSGPIEIESHVQVNGVAVTDPVISNGPIVYTTVSAGLHQLSVRARGADGAWVGPHLISAQVSVPAPPTFTQSPSLLPAVVAGGQPITVNPGSGPNLVWTFTLNGVDVRSQVVNGQYTPPLAGGLLALSSTISNAGGSVTQTVNATATTTSTGPGPNEPETVITMNQDGFTVEDAGTAYPATITPTQDGFTVETN